MKANLEKQFNMAVRRKLKELEHAADRIRKTAFEVSNKANSQHEFLKTNLLEQSQQTFNSLGELQSTAAEFDRLCSEVETLRLSYLTVLKEIQESEK